MIEISISEFILSIK